MSASSGPHFFISYSRTDTTQKQNIVKQLRARGINLWVDIENLVPGTPAWEREIERAIRSAAGIIVLLSPESNNSEWVRREISFAEQHEKQVFPVLIHGDEDDSIPLRLSNHQRVDLRRNYNNGLDELADALKDHLGVTAVNKQIQQKKQTITREDLKKLALPAGLILLGLSCVSGFTLAARLIGNIDLPTQAATTPPVVDPVITPAATEPFTNRNQPTGKIIYTCQIKGDEICVVNADGAGWHQLTNASLACFNASPSPDGKKIVFVSGDNKKSEIYDLDLDSGKSTQLTDLNKNLGSPEISPDDKYIIFHYRSGNDNVQLWIMNRDGSNPREFFTITGKDAHDATWSPDGKKILFALGRGENNKLYIINFDTSDPKLVNDAIDTRGRSDWSVSDLITFDQGGPFMHDVYLMNVDGSNLRRISQAGTNAQGASLSPDGKWIAFTAYTDVGNKDTNSCEIFIMRVDGSDVQQLTKNNYCDYQPRWGS